MLCGALLTEAFLFSTEHFGLLLLLLLLHRIGSTFTVTWIYWSWYIGKYFSLVGKCHEIGENGQKQRAKIDRPIKVNEERKYLMHVKKFSVRFFSSPPQFFVLFLCFWFGWEVRFRFVAISLVFVIFDRCEIKSRDQLLYRPRHICMLPQHKHV